MFVLDQDPRFTHTVDVSKPVDGGFETQTFRGTFRVMGVAEIAGFDLNDAAASTEFLQKVLVGFDDVQGGDDKPLPFSDRTRDALIDVPFVRIALVKSYFGGVNKATLGN